MKIIKEKHSLVLRWTHWVNFPMLTIMIWSDLLIYWANDVYHITLFGHRFVRFFHEWFYDLLGVPHRLSGEWKYLVPQKKSFKEAWQVLLHDL